MKNEKHQSLKPVLGSLASIGISAVTSIASGSATLAGIGLAGKIVNDILGSISGNIAADQLMKIDSKELRRWWVKEGKGISNHDLFKALQQAVFDALTGLQSNYELYYKLRQQEEGKKTSPYHLKAIDRKIKVLQKKVQEGFWSSFFEGIEEDEILDLADQRNDKLFENIADFLAVDELSKYGPIFFEFAKGQLPHLIILAFSEQLKTNQRVWVAYQRNIVTELKNSTHQIEGITTTISDKLNNLSQQLEVLNSSYDNKMPIVDILWQQFDSLKSYFEGSNENLDALCFELREELTKMTHEFSIKLDLIGYQITEESERQSAYRKEAQQEREEIISAIKSTALQAPGKRKISNEELESRVLPRYLNWLLEEYARIQLPSIQEKKITPYIPLEKVYVALQLTDEKTRQEIQYGSQLFSKKVKEQESQIGRKLTEEEQSSIRANVIQGNRVLRNFRSTGLGGVDKEIEEQVRQITLSDAFQRERYLVILGDPGSGKSTLAKWLTLKLANSFDQYLRDQNVDQVLVPANQVHGRENIQDENFISLGQIRLPILIKIPEYTKYYEEHNIGKGIIDFIGTHLPTIPGLEREEVHQLAQKFLLDNKAVIILDGMDEVVRNRGDIIDEIERFISRWINLGYDHGTLGSPLEDGGNQIVITSRIVGYHASPLNSEFTHVYVREMNREAIESFCDLWTRQILLQELLGQSNEAIENVIQQDAYDLKSAIFDDSKPRVRELATNPLLITILALLFGYQNKELPKSRVELYQRTIEILTAKWLQIHESQKGVSPSELSAILQSLAYYIHASPSEDITETEFKEILERELRTLRHISIQQDTPAQILDDTRDFIRIVKQDVGLLSERGEKLYHFLHRTFQEYLAAQKLVSIPHKAIDNIIDRMSDPVWREPVLLALAYAGKFWSTNRFNTLVKSLLEAEDQLKDLIPRGILLIATALQDMDTLSSDLFKDLVRKFLAAFGDQKGIGRFAPIKRAIKSIIDDLRKSDRSEAFESVCEDLLAESTYKNEQWALLSLSAQHNWYKQEWIPSLIRQIANDRPEWNWPIDLILLKIFAERGQIKSHNTLRFKNKVLERTDYQQMILSDPYWLRLIAVLYGGWAYDEILNKIKEFEMMKFQINSGTIDMQTEAKRFAIRLDTEGGQLENQLKTGLHFDFNFIHRESPFTRDLLRALSSQVEGKDLIPYFQNVWKTEQNICIRAQALLALAALGENVAKIIYQISDHSMDLETSNLFLEHLSRLERNLSLPFACLWDRASSHKKLLEHGWDNIHEHFYNYVWSIFSDTLSKVGLPPRKSFASIPSERIWDSNKVELDQIHLYLGNESESYVSLLSQATDDPIYSFAVQVDTQGKYLRSLNNSWLVGSLNMIPEARNLQNPFSVDWKIPSYYFKATTRKDKLILALRVVAGLPNIYVLAKEYFILSLWPNLEEIPELKHYALSLFIRQKHSKYIRQKVLEVYGEHSSLTGGLYQSMKKIQNPFIRLLIALQIEENTPGFRMAPIIFKSIQELERPEEWIIAFMELHKSSVFLIILLFGNEMQLIGEIDYAKKLGGENPADNILKRQKRIEEPYNAFKAKIFAAEVAKDEQREALLFSAMDDISKFENDYIRAIALEFILNRHAATVTHFPDWEKINNAFKSSIWKNYGLGKHYHNLFQMSIFFEKKDAEDSQNSISGWTSFALLRMTFDLRQRFSDRDIYHALIRKMREGENPEEALGQLLEKGFKGFPLTLQVANAIDHFLKEDRIDWVKAILPHIDLRNNPLDWVSYWKNSPHLEIRQFFDLLSAESGLLNKKIIDSLIQLLLEGSDKIRLRVTFALNSPSPFIQNERRKFTVKGIGIDTLFYLMEKENRILSTNIIVSSKLYRISCNLFHNDPNLVPELYDKWQDSPSNKLIQDTISSIFSGMERAEVEVIDKMYEFLRFADPEFGKFIWKGIANLATADSYRKSFIPMIKLDRLDSELKHPKTRKALLLIEKNAIHFKSDNLAKLILELKDMAPDQDEALKRARFEIKERGLISFAKAMKESTECVLESLIKFGDTGYFSESDVNATRKTYSPLIGQSPFLVKLLFDWTMQELQNDLESEKSSSYGQDLCNLLAQISIDFPETFELLADRSIAQSILPEVVSYHTKLMARCGAIEILAQLKTIDLKVLKAIVHALEDDVIIRKAAVKNFDAFNEIFDSSSLEQLKNLLDGNSATIAAEAAKILCNISMKSSLDVELRKTIIQYVANALREQIKVSHKKRFIYGMFKNDVGSTHYQIVIEGKLEDILYDKLVRLTGIK